MKNQFPRNYFHMFILLTSLFFSCSTPKPSPIASQTDTLKHFVLKYDRSPCFGTCPVYSFYILKDHTGLVNSKANLTDTAGWYSANLDQEMIVEILELIEPDEWWHPDLGQEPEIADLPASTLSYFHTKGFRNLTIQSRTNHALETVFGKINHLVTESIWTPTKIRPIETTISELTDVIVYLKENVDINTWMKKFERYGIRLKKRIAPNQQFYIVSKDPAKGVANDFLQYIKLDPDVIEAQWDKQLQQRN